MNEADLDKLMSKFKHTKTPEQKKGTKQINKPKTNANYMQKVKYCKRTINDRKSSCLQRYGKARRMVDQLLAKKLISGWKADL